MSEIVVYRDRVGAIGMNGSGKSELGRHLFEQAVCRRLMVDPKHSWRVEGVPALRDVAQVDWRAPVIHFQPRWRDRAQLDDLYGEAFKRLRHALIWTDEAHGASDANWEGSALVAIQTQGRELEIGHIWHAQRPVNIRRELLTESDDLFLFANDLDARDLDTLAGAYPFAQLKSPKRQTLIAGLQPFESLWLDKRAKKLRVVDPLPDELRRPSLVFRRGGES